MDATPSIARPGNARLAGTIPSAAQVQALLAARLTDHPLGRWVRVEGPIVRQLNVVYTVSGRGKSSCVFKVCRDYPLKVAELGISDESSFAKERLMYEVVRTRTRVPVPLFYTHGQIADGQTTLRFALISKVPGAGLRTLFWSLPRRARHRLIESVALTLRQIHSIRFERAGYITDCDIRNPYGDTAKDFAIGKLIKSLRLCVDRGSMTAAQADVMVAAVDRSGAFAGEVNALLHNDYGIRGNNIIVGANGSVAGVIDFERARSGDPVEEIARLHLDLCKSFICDVLGGRELPRPRELKSMISDIADYIDPFLQAYGGEVSRAALDTYMHYVGSTMGIESLRM